MFVHGATFPRARRRTVPSLGGSKSAERSKPPSVRPSIRLSVRVLLGADPEGTTGEPDAPSGLPLRRGLAPVRIHRSIRSRPSSLRGLSPFPYGSVRVRPSCLGHTGDDQWPPPRLIGRVEGCRFCSRASRLRLRACARSPVQTVGGLSSCPSTGTGTGLSLPSYSSPVPRISGSIGGGRSPRPAVLWGN